MGGREKNYLLCRRDMSLLFTQALSPFIKAASILLLCFVVIADATDGARVGGHNPFAIALIFALETFLVVLPPSEITRLRSLGKLCRGFVQVFLATPFHGLKLA